MVRRFSYERAKTQVRLAAKDIRLALGWSHARFALEIGVTRGGVLGMESGNSDFSVRSIERIWEVTGIDPYMLESLRTRDFSALRGRLPSLHIELKDEWEKQLDDMRHARHLLPKMDS